MTSPTGYPRAAGSLWEELEETLMAHRLRLPGPLRQALSSTKESGNLDDGNYPLCVHGTMTLRNAATGLQEAEHSFRRIKAANRFPSCKARWRINRVRRLDHTGICFPRPSHDSHNGCGRLQPKAPHAGHQANGCLSDSNRVYSARFRASAASSSVSCNPR